MSKFSSDIHAWAKKAEKRIDEVVYGACFQITESIIMRTPVDTGRAAGNWIASVDQPSSSVIGSFGESSGKPKTGDARKINVSQKQGVLADAEPKIRDAIGKRFFLVNNLPYIRRLEYGSSKQMPRGMVRVSVAYFKVALKKAIRSA